MIRLQDYTPGIYYQQSRDFQFIGRLYDIIFNSVKNSATNLYHLPIGKNMDEKLLNLLSTTLGFQSKHHYNSKQLAALCSVLPQVLREKGSINAITTAVNALLCAEGIKQALDYTVTSKQYITLYLPQQLSDLNLLKDLMVYILPAGLGCQMVKEISVRTEATTTIGASDIVTAYVEDTEEVGKMLQIRGTSPNDTTTKESYTDAEVKNTSGILVNDQINGLGGTKQQ